MLPNFALCDTIEKPSLRAFLQILRQFFEETRKSMSELLLILELIRAGARAAGIADFLFPCRNFEMYSRGFATRAPQVNLNARYRDAAPHRPPIVVGVFETSAPSQYCSPSISMAGSRRQARWP